MILTRPSPGNYLNTGFYLRIHGGFISPFCLKVTQTHFAITADAAVPSCVVQLTPGPVLTLTVVLLILRCTRCTHLCSASRTSPCRASLGRCATAPWRTRWRWSCTGGSPRRRSFRSSRRTPSPAQWELAVWRPDVDGYQRGFEARLEHAGKQNQTEDRVNLCWYLYLWTS